MNKQQKNIFHNLEENFHLKIVFLQKFKVLALLPSAFRTAVERTKAVFILGSLYKNYFGGGFIFQENFEIFSLTPLLKISVLWECISVYCLDIGEFFTPKHFL